MKIHRIFIPHSDIAGDEILFSEKDSHYLRTVLRLKSGQELEVLDGSRQYIVRLTDTDRDRVRGEVQEVRTLRTRKGIRIALAFACVRPGPFQEILRHCTELGVTRFIPILSRRAVRRPVEKKERWESVVKAASAQSRRFDTPEVEPPVTLKHLIDRARDADIRILLSPTPNVIPILTLLERAAPGSALILVGPEGGLEPEEEAQAVEAGFQPVSLGPGVLRTETAAMVAVGTLRTWYDRWQHSSEAMPSGSTG